MPWFHGPRFLERLETAAVADAAHRQPFRLPRQWVDRPNLAFRGYSRHGAGRADQRDQAPVNVNTLAETARHLALNDVAVCDFAFDRPVPFDTYRDNPATWALWRTSAGWQRCPG